MNLLKEIRDANDKAEREHPGYKGPLDGFAGKGADIVWKNLSPEAQKIWSEQNWPKALLLDVDGLRTWACAFGKDICRM